MIEEIRDPVRRARAAGDFIAKADRQSKLAVELRRKAIREVLTEHGVAETARLCGVSVSTVKVARG